MADQLKKLGRYSLLNRLAEGGTAEVYRGLLDKGDGTQRLVAVKALHRAHAADETYLDFIREETKLMVGLCHPNIVQTLDAGEDNGRPFIVFEYVHGRSLKQVVDRLSDLGRPFQVELATFIAEQAAGALHYGHVFQNPSGSTLHIIHRDVSPHNIMVAYDGVPKMIDFGIAKVLQRGEQTKAGIIKGKPAYLSPEQALLKPVDARSDIFALGTVLWESLTGRRLFGGMEKGATLRAISDESVVIAPPSMINPSVSQALDTIVLKALQRDPEKRFKSAHELQVQLHQTLEYKNREHYHRELSALMTSVFSGEIEREREELKRLGAVVEKITRQSVSDPSWLIPAVMPAVSRGGLSAAPSHPEITHKFPVRTTGGVGGPSPSLSLPPPPPARTLGLRKATGLVFGLPNLPPTLSISRRMPSKLKQFALGGAFAVIAAGAFLVATSPGKRAAPVPIAQAIESPVPAPTRAPSSVAKKKHSTKKHQASRHKKKRH